MKGVKEDNAIYIVQKAIDHFKIKVSGTTIRETLQNHPNYPSLKCICDALSSWNIECYPLKLQFDEMVELGGGFIAHLKIAGGQLAFVKTFNTDKITFYLQSDKEITVEFDDFMKISSGVVIVIQANAESGEKDFRIKFHKEILNKNLFTIAAISIIAILLLVFNTQVFGRQLLSSKIFFGSLVINLLGIVTSILLILHEFKINIALTDKICHVHSSFDCNKILNSNAATLFGWINWADTGLIYFLGTLVYLVGSPEKSRFVLLALVSVFPMPILFYLAYSQLVVLKKICPLCLATQILLLAQFAIFLPLINHVEFRLFPVIRLLTGYVIVASILLLYKAYYLKNNEFEKEHKKLLQFKSDSKTFLFHLESSRYIDFSEIRGNITIRTIASKIDLVAFLGLNCNHCGKVFDQIIQLSEQLPVNVEIFFPKPTDPVSKDIIYQIENLNEAREYDALFSMIQNWYNDDPRAFIKKLNAYDLGDNETTVLDGCGDETDYFNIYEINTTPKVFLNGYQLPGIYELNEVIYFTDEIIALTQRKRQEAHIKVG